MEVVVTTGAINRAKLQSNPYHQQTNTQFLQAGCSSCRPTNNVKALKGIESLLASIIIIVIIVVVIHHISTKWSCKTLSNKSSFVCILYFYTSNFVAVDWLVHIQTGAKSRPLYVFIIILTSCSQFPSNLARSHSDEYLTSMSLPCDAAGG